MSQIVTLVYNGTHRFRFCIEATPSMQGKLMLDDESHKLLRQLLQAEGEDWWCDENGDRLSPELLFAKSPWSQVIGGNTTKLLCRTINLSTGDAMFSTASSYGA